MPLSDADIEQFRDSFEVELVHFMEQQQIGDPSQWKVQRIKLKQEKPRISFQQPDGSLKSFALHQVPKPLAAEERAQLRALMNDVCAELGFTPYQIHAAHFDSATMSAVRAGEPAAWRTFAERYYPALEDYAASELRTWRGNDALPDAEDLADEAVARLLQQIGKGALSPDAKLKDFIYLYIHRLAPRMPLKQSDERMIHDRAQPEYDGMVDRLSEQLPVILEKARAKLTPRQQETMDIVVNADHPLTLQEIGEALGIKSKRAQEPARQHMNRVTWAIRKTAHELGEEYEETAQLIDDLANANAKGITIRAERRSSKPRER